PKFFERASIKIPAHLPEIYADPISIRQVFTNILTNSIKFTQHLEKPLIELSHQEKEDEVVLSVIDNGIGVTQDQLKNIFDLFYTQSPSKQGNGIGLTIVKKIVEKHGGEVEACSQGLNKGLKLTIHLPKT
ncbi:MAG: ATP-binding protein, partial [Bacteroidota bacterium]